MVISVWRMSSKQFEAQRRLLAENRNMNALILIHLHENLIITGNSPCRLSLVFRGLLPSFQGSFMHLEE